jgi:hypothetical protein
MGKQLQWLEGINAFPNDPVMSDLYANRTIPFLGYPGH